LYDFYQILLDFVSIDQISSLAYYHTLPIPSLIYRDHGHTTCHRLDSHHPEVFIRTDAYARYGTIDNMREILIFIQSVKKNIRVPFSHLKEFIPLTIVFSVEYDDIFVWHSLKSSDDGIDPFGVSQS
jgi:hypothetical protein